MNSILLLILLETIVVRAIYIDLNTFQTKMSQTINSIRLMHGVSELKSQPALMNTAQLYATKLAVMDSGIIRDNTDLINCGILLQSVINSDIIDRSQLKCGESLAQTAAYSNISYYCNPVYIAQLWYSQRKDYDYSNPNTQLNSDFTQLIWKSSIYLGVGVALNKQQTGCYIVVRYWPSGNIIGEYKNNVLISSFGSRLNIDFFALITLIIIFIPIF